VTPCFYAGFGRFAGSDVARGTPFFKARTRWARLAGFEFPPAPRPG
jgi:hypothetical protein